MLRLLRKLRDQRGLSTIEATIAAAAVIAVGVAGYNLLSDLSKTMMGGSLVGGVGVARSLLLDSINGTEAWRNSLVENPTVQACLSNGATCGSLIGQKTPVKVLDNSGAIIADPADAAVGFDLNGKPCHNYPELPCAVRFNVTWTPLCTGNAAPCVNPQEKVEATLVLAPKFKDAIHKEAYSFVSYRGLAFSSFADTCLSLGGVWDNASRSCNLPLKGLCPNGQIVVGIDSANNQKICKPYWTGSCPAGYVLKGADATGAPICRVISCPTTPYVCYTDPSLCTVLPPGGDGGGGDGGCGGSDAGGGCK